MTETAETEAPETEAPEKGKPRPLTVRIPLVTRAEEAEACWAAMSQGGIWDAFVISNVNGPGMLFIKVHSKRIALHMIKRNEPGHPEDGAVVGVVMLDLSSVRKEGVSQLYIGLVPGARGAGLTVGALSLAFDAHLIPKKIPTIWGAINAKNDASLGMVRACKVPEIDETVHEDEDGNELRYKIFEMTLETWQRVRGIVGMPDPSITLPLCEPEPLDAT